MPATLDLPSETSAIDSFGFDVSGWLWLGDHQADIAAVEARAGDILLGEAVALSLRPDVTAALGLSAQALTGFTLRARHPLAKPGGTFELCLRARFRDGTRTEVLVRKKIACLASHVHPLGALRAGLSPAARGLEIGAHALPTPGLAPFFTDTVATYAGSAGRVDFLADARALPIPGDTLDYLCSSHVIEHIPDPLAALHEWHRVLRPGGLLYLVAPDKRFTFDAPRPVTSVDHILRNFHEPSDAADTAAHIDEFIYQTDWEKLQPGTPPLEKPLRQAASRDHYLREFHAGRMIDIHFHTFTPDSLHDLLCAAGLIDGLAPLFELVARAERYPPERTDGIAFLLCKRASAAPAPHALETAVLGHADPSIAPLPLVCPITLSPLRATTDAAGERGLNSATGGHRYPYAGSLPSLLTPLDSRPVRPWLRRT